MARPRKNNAEYFSHDHDMRNGDRVRAIRTKFEHVGYSIYNMMLEKLTDAEGFELEYSNEKVELWTGDFGAILATELKEIIEYFLHIGSLKEKDGMIFSPELKLRLAPVLEKRDRERNKSSGRKRHDDGTFVGSNPTTGGVSAAETPQSKVKESKVNKSKKLMPNFLEDFEKLISENEIADRGYLEKTIEQIPRCKKEDIEKIKEKAKKIQNCIYGKRFKLAGVMFREIAGIVNDSQMAIKREI